jgi:hypothetical protein
VDDAPLQHKALLQCHLAPAHIIKFELAHLQGTPTPTGHTNTASQSATPTCVKRAIICGHAGSSPLSLPKEMSLQYICYDVTVHML